MKSGNGRLEVPQQVAGRHLGEGRQSPVGMGKGVIFGAGIGNHHHAQAGGVGGAMAGHGVFKRDRIGPVHAEPSAGLEVDVGGGFAEWDVFPAYHGGEAVKQTEAAQVLVDVDVRRIGSDRERDTVGRGVGQQILHAGQDGLVGDDAVLVSGELALQSDSIVRDWQTFPRIKPHTHMTDDSLSAGAIEFAAKLGMHGRPRVDQGRFRIENESVKIQHQSSYHWGAMVVPEMSASGGARFAPGALGASLGWARYNQPRRRMKTAMPPVQRTVTPKVTG